MPLWPRNKILQYRRGNPSLIDARQTNAMGPQPIGRLDLIVPRVMNHGWSCAAFLAGLRPRIWSLCRCLAARSQWMDTSTRGGEIGIEHPKQIVLHALVCCGRVMCRSTSNLDSGVGTDFTCSDERSLMKRSWTALAVALITHPGPIAGHMIRPIHFKIITPGAWRDKRFHHPRTSSAGKARISCLTSMAAGLCQQTYVTGMEKNRTTATGHG